MPGLFIIFILFFLHIYRQTIKIHYQQHTHTHTRAHTQTLNMLECQEKCDNVVAAVSVFDLNRVIKGPD